MPELTFHDCGAAYRKNYALACADLNDLMKRGDGKGFKELFGSLCLYDLFFLLHFALDIREINHPWLVERVKEVEDHNENTIDLWPRFHFKAVDLKAWVPTPIGLRQHGDLKVGDEVFGPDGNPAKIIATTPIFTDADCWLVRFDKGYEVTVSGDHLWEVNISSMRRVPGGREGRRSVILNTRELATELKLSQEYKSRVLPSIPIALPLHFAEGKVTRSGRHAIISVEKVSTVPVSCIQVDRPDGMYLLGEHCIPTHNSTIITYGLIIQDILKDPEERIVIFSWSKDSAGDFLTKIKQTLEDNNILKATFDNVLYQKPSVEAPQWSVEGGLTVKRRGKYLENTLEGHSIEKLPTGKHFTKSVYDDIEVPENVTTPDMIKKIESQFRMSSALIDGVRNRSMVAGTIYHFAGIHSAVLLKDTSWHQRVHKATDDGTISGKPVLMTQKAFTALVKKLGPYHAASQMLMNPVAAELQEFKEEWLEYYAKLPARLNKYLIVDPANEKHKKSDYTCMAVIGIDALQNYFLIDLIRKKMNLPERKDALFRMVEKHPNIKMPVGYEEYGANSDTQYIKECQKNEGVLFRILPLGGTVLSKEDRERKTIPIFADHKFFLPFSIMQGSENLIKTFIQEEYLLFPFAPHDDILDCISRIKDPKLNAKAPVNYQMQGQNTEPQVITTWDPHNAYVEGASR